MDISQQIISIICIVIVAIWFCNKAALLVPLKCTTNYLGNHSLATLIRGLLRICLNVPLQK